MSQSAHPKSMLSAVRAAAGFALAVVTSLTFAGPAQAGTYHVYSCQTPYSLKASAADWKFNLALPNDNGLTDNCPYEMQLKSGHAAFSAGTQSTLSLSTPGTLKIGAVRVERQVAITGTNTSDTIGSSPQFLMVAGAAHSPVVEQCNWFVGCRGLAWPGYVDGSPTVKADFGAGGADSLAFAVSCEGTYGSCGPSEGTAAQSRVTAYIHAVDMTMVDNESPVAQAVTGTVVKGAALRGTETLSFTGNDNAGAGVYQAIVAWDGNETSRVGVDTLASCKDVEPRYGNDLEFDRVRPCPLTASFGLDLDTTKLAEGAHRLKVSVRDAAGNTSAVYDGNVVVDNIPAPAVSIAPSIVGGTPAGGLRPGDTLVAADGTWTGSVQSFGHRWQRLSEGGTWVDIPNATGAKYTLSTDDVGHPVRVVVTAKSADGNVDAVTEATAVVKSGATVQTQSLAPGAGTTAPATNGVSTAAGGGDPTGGQLVLDREQKSVDVKYGVKIVITGRLVDANNQPIANAQVDVFEQLVKTAASWNKIGTIKTDSQGGYVYRPKTTASRRLRFAWADKIDAAQYRATRDVVVSVTAGMDIRAQHKVVSRSSVIRLSGKVSLDGLPVKGAWVEVQVLDAKVWRTVATRKLSAAGKWTFRHRLTSSARITFAFRSRLRPSGEISAVESKSVPVKVRVR